jgi:CheY-like chemotaxis protein
MSIDEKKILESRNGAPYRILIVDDEENVRNVFKDFCLSSPLFKVATASGGQEAIEMADRDDFDIVTMDLVMPDVSGLEATDSLIRQAGHLGGCRIMHKPVGVEEFLQELIELAQEKC